MPNEDKLEKKLKKYEEKINRLLEKRHAPRARSRSRSRSRLRIRQETSHFSDSDPPSDPPDVEEDNVGAGQQQDLDDGEKQDDNINVITVFQDALGEEYEDDNKFEGQIQQEITKRWNHILVNGLTKDEKDTILKKYKLPENCQLLEAPILNEEVKTAMTENAKIRDRSLEIVQHQLGIATAIVGQVMTDLIEYKEDIDKIQLVKKLTDATKLLNEIHFQKTKTRRHLISPLLEKNFNNLVEKVKRDEQLYGIDLGSKIKTSQELKRSSSQIKKSIITKSTPNKTAYKFKITGNRYGPPQNQPRQQARATAPRGGPRNRATHLPPRRPGPSYSRPERAAQRGSHSRH